MLKEKIVESEEDFKAVTKRIDASFRPDIKKAIASQDPLFDRNRELGDVYEELDLPREFPATSNGKASEKRFVDAIHLSLKQAFSDDDTLVMMGQDIAEYGGVFKVTEGFTDLFGKDRIRNTPIIESGAIGAAMGLALEGFKAVVEIQFADFISCGFNQIVNNLAKTRYRWGAPLNITIRAPHGAGVGAGPFHSQSVEGWFMQIPGLKVVVPATVADAQNLLYSSLMDPNPVLFFEHKKLYRSLRDMTNDRAVPEPLGKARVFKEGTDATIITYGMGVHWAEELAKKWKTKSVSIEVIDLRTLLPLDLDTIKKSAAKTHRVLLLQEPSLTLGPMAEVSALISEHCFEELDAPIIRCGAMDMPIPHQKNLEDEFLKRNIFEDKLEKLLSY